MSSVIKIISGGQTGADQGGLEAGRALGLETGGHIPLGFKTEDGPRPDLASYGLQETFSSDYPPRTRLNIGDADGTVIFGNETERGSALTKNLCEHLKKPCWHISYHVDPVPDPLALVMFRKWIETNNIRILNVAGNRESKNRGIQSFVKTFLVEALKDLEVPAE